MGFNGETTNTDLSGRVWADPKFVATVTALRPGNLRIFGGTSANLWGWSQGRIIQSGLPGTIGYLAGHPLVPILLPEFATVLDSSGSTPVFDLNLVSSTLSDQLGMLRAAQANGLAVQRVELGNELWSPAYTANFPSGAAYASTANIWIDALHQAFPGVQVSVDMNTPSETVGTRGSSWNRELFAELRGADAVSVHAYIQDVDGTPTQIVTGAATTWKATAAAVEESAPPGLPVWVTEWNYAPPHSGSPIAWARAVGNAVFALSALRNERVALIDLHELVGFLGSAFGSVTVSEAPNGALSYGLSPSGDVVKGILGVLDGCTQIRPVAIGPETSGTPAVSGTSCRNGRAAKAFLVNPTSAPHTIELSALGSTVGAQAEILSTNPLSTARFSPRPQEKGIVNDVLVLPPWSVASILG